MVLEKVKEIIINQLGVKPEEVTPEASFLDDLHADDLDMSILIMEIEGEFNIEIPDTAAQQLDSVGKMIAYVEERVKGGN